MFRKLAPSLFGAALALTPAVAAAQDEIPSIDPSGGAYEEPPPPETAPPMDYQVPQGEGGQPATGAPGEQPVEDMGYYHYDDEGLVPADDQTMIPHHGPVPGVHVVRSGDTLWDICAYYFNNPWDWPRIWSYNPSITNPHWIYPGDQVRLHSEADMQARGEVEGTEPGPEDTGPGDTGPEPGERTSDSGFRVRQLTFLEKDKLDADFKITGAEEERVMLSQNDVVYLEYPPEAPPQVGRRYAVYSETEAVKDRKGNDIGSYVHVYGEVEVLSVKKDKRARAVVRESSHPIERDMRVGPVKGIYKNVEDTPNSENRRGTIVAQLHGDELIGALQVVFIDLGANDGLAEGNRLFVVRRGDARPEMFDLSAEKQDDRFPPYAIGEIIVVQVGEQVSVASVTLSLQEAEVGDFVLMRKAR